MKTVHLKVILISAVIVGLLSFLVYFFYSRTVTAEEARDVALALNRQQQANYEEFLRQHSDSVSILSVKVENLNKEIVSEKQKTLTYVALVTDLRVQIAKGKKEKNPPTSVVEDSNITIVFTGKEGLVSYEGWTNYNVIDREADYDISTSVEDFQLKASLFRDNTTNLWKIGITSTHPELKFTQNSVVDSAFFPQLYSLKPLSVRSSYQPSIGFSAGVYSSFSFINEPFVLGAYVQVYYKQAKVTWKPLSQTISLNYTLFRFDF